ncbi:MAG: cation transporter [Acidithiobacillus sp.]
MAADCCSSDCSTHTQTHPRYRKVLWAALLVNTAIFAIELFGGFHAGSASLLADAADFLGDAANYGLSLAVLAQGLLWRSRAALVKGTTMGVFSVFVLDRIGWGGCGRIVARAKHDEHDCLSGAVGKSRGGGPALCLSQRRRQHALGLAVQP